MEVIFMNVEKKLTRFERARLLGARAIQISMGARPLVEITDSLDPIDIAYEELKAGVLPLDYTRVPVYYIPSRGFCQEVLGRNLDLPENSSRRDGCAYDKMWRQMCTFGRE